MEIKSRIFPVRVVSLLFKAGKLRVIYSARPAEAVQKSAANRPTNLRKLEGIVVS